jgi:hypothetical protein
LKFAIPLIKAQELLDQSRAVNARTIKAVALEAGMAYKEADRLQNQMMLQEMKQ